MQMKKRLKKDHILGSRRKGKFSLVAQSCPTLRTRGLQNAITNSQSMLKLMSIQPVMPSNHLILCYSLLLPSVFPRISNFFPMNWLFTSGGQSIGASASASVLTMNIQGWFPLGLTGWISLQSKGLSRVFSSTTVWKRQFLGTQPSLCSNSHTHIWLLENHSSDYTDLCWQSDVFAFV